MRTDRKARAQQLASDLHASTTPEALQIREFVMLQFEEAKASLVDAEGDDIFRQQGAARGLRKLHDMLTRKPITPKEQ